MKTALDMFEEPTFDENLMYNFLSFRLKRIYTKKNLFSISLRSLTSLNY